MAKGSPRWRLMMVLVGCLQNFLMGGVIFGWAAISNTMLLSSDGAPGLDAPRIHQMFTMASSSNMVSPLFLGLVLDRFGPRACSVTSIAFSTLGFFLFGTAAMLAPAHAPAAFGLGRRDLFSLSVVLIGFGGPGVQNAVIHTANLFPANKCLVTAIITGCFQLSFIIFFFFDQIWFFGGVDYKAIFIAYSAVCFLCLGASVFLWPDKPFQFDEEVRRASPATRRALGPNAVASSTLHTPPPEARSVAVLCAHPPGLKLGLIRFPSTFRRPSPSDARAAPEATAAAAHAAASGGGAPERNGGGGGVRTPGTRSPPAPWCRRARLQEQPLGQQLRSGEFLSATALLTVASFWANFYIGAADLQLADQAFMSPRQQAAAMRWFTVVTVLGVAGIPFVGYSMDTLGFRATRAITVGLGCGWSLLTLMPHKDLLLPSFAVYALFRTFTFNYYFAYLADRLGFRYFGVLAGASFFVAGLVGFVLQGPMLTFGHGSCGDPGATPASCGHGNWVAVNALQLGSTASLFLSFLVRAPPPSPPPQVGYGSFDRAAAASGQDGGLPPRGKSHSAAYELVTQQRVQIGV